MVSNIHNMLKSQEGTSGQPQSVGDSNSVPRRINTDCWHLDSKQVGNFATRR